MSDKMDALRAWYRQGLEARVDELNATFRAYEKGEPNALESLRRHAHSLAGSGGSYGFHEITAAARALEHAPEQELEARFDELVGVLREVHTASKRRDEP